MNPQIQPQALARFSSLHNILCCPDTKTALRLVGIEELCSCLADGKRERIPDGTIGAFISDARQRAFPLTERLVNFLEQSSLPVRTEFSGTASSIAPTNPDEDLKQSVREWYDQFGWQTNEQGCYNDTATFSQTTLVGHGLYELMSHLSILDRLPGGGFVLDAASGAIAHPEYLAFSWFFKSRVCVDMSISALREADGKLRQADFCCLADICRLPFRDETFDGTISGYTIQHVPESQQLRAVKELYRVIRPSARLCILTEVRNSTKHKGLILLLRSVRKLLEVLHLIRPPVPSPSAPSSEKMCVEPPPHELYFLPREVAQWKKIAGELTSRYSIESLRILNKSEFERLFGRSNYAAKALRLIENTFPRLTSGVSAYCLIDIGKPTGNNL